MIKETYKFAKKHLYTILRAQATPHKVALSVAVGFFVACFIPVGGHTLVVLLLAFLLRVDKIIAFIATWIANPYTIPLMYPAFCFIGSKIIGVGLSFHHINFELKHIISNFHWHDVVLLGKELILSLLVGGFVCGVIIAGLGYFVSYKLAQKYNKKRLAKKKLSTDSRIEL